MASIHLKNLGHRYPASDAESDNPYALNPLDQVWEDGGAYALLGPSGCGKTTLLNIISGLLRPSEGRVLFDGEDVTDLSTERRNIAQVFQFPVVYDTLTVAENLAFPLRNRGIDNATIEARVADTLSMLGLDARANERARSLNADDKQKISLGRGLVRTDVRAILFDEPLTVIDPHLKWQLRTELKKIHERFGHTMIYVTHDQTEALTFADKVVVNECRLYSASRHTEGIVRQTSAHIRRHVYRLPRYECAELHIRWHSSDCRWRENSARPGDVRGGAGAGVGFD